MKKIILFACVAAAVTTTSCRKERTCECTTTTTSVLNAGPLSATNTYITSNKTTIEKQRKRDFKLMTDCVSSTQVNPQNNGSQTIDRKCEIK